MAPTSKVQEGAKANRRKSALKSARAAGKAQLKAEGGSANEDDIRITKSQISSKIASEDQTEDTVQTYEE